MRWSGAQVRIALGDDPLHVDRAQHRLDDARELHERAVARELDDAAVVLGDPAAR